MTETDGDDPEHDLPVSDKDQFEAHLRKLARQRLMQGQSPERKRLLDRAPRSLAGSRVGHTEERTESDDESATQAGMEGRSVGVDA